MRKHRPMFITVFLIILLLALSVVMFAFFGFDNEPTAGNGGESNETNVDLPHEAISDEERLQRISEIDAILSDPYMILVNADNGVGSDFVPADLVTIQDKMLERVAAEQLELMLDDAAAAGYDTINIYSAYRNYTKQETNYNNKVEYYIGEGYSREEAEEKAATIVNPPGKSEHQTGLATDICTADIVNKYASLHEDFEFTDEYKWLVEHCAEYGFVLRYPKDKVQITGISYEPWHYRYVGVTRAKEIMSKGVCLEEYIDELLKEKAALEK